MNDQMKRFGGDLSTMWRFDILPPIKRLSWWWWWFILVLPDPKHPERSRQLMVLWSTKETPSIRVNNHWWKPGARMSIDEHDGHVLPGMVCAWWYECTTGDVNGCEQLAILMGECAEALHALQALG